MANLSFGCLILTDGSEPKPAYGNFGIERLEGAPDRVEPGELFGPHAQAFVQALKRFRAAFLFSGEGVAGRESERFFATAQAALTRSVTGQQGFVVDLFKRWPRPISELADLPEDVLPEDLFSMRTVELPNGRFRAETFGLCRLGQKEISFQFSGLELADEAVALCARLADYALVHRRSVEAGQVMGFGFDRLAFSEAPERLEAGALWRWCQPHLARRWPGKAFASGQLLTAELMLPASEERTSDLREALHRAREQHRLTEELDVLADSPNETASALGCPCLQKAATIQAHREEATGIRDSGWRLTCGHPHDAKDLQLTTLGTLATQLPQLVRYLALPTGCRVTVSGNSSQVDLGSAPRSDADFEI